MASATIARCFSIAHRRVLPGKKQFSALVSLDYEFPDIPSVSPEAAKATSVSVSTLSNGLTVASESSSMTSTVTMTYPKAGSAAEMLDEQGAALVNKGLNFKSGSGLSTILINRSIEDEGGVPFSSVDRCSASLGYTVTPDKAVGLIPLLATDCSFEKWDIRDAVGLAATEVEVSGTSAQIVLTENVFAAAFGPQSPAGRALYSNAPSLDIIKGFRNRAYGVQGAVLTATGIKDHSAFCAEVEDLLSDAPSGSGGIPMMEYIGGESRVAIQGASYGHVAMAFPAPASSALSSIVKHFFSTVGAPEGVSGFSTSGLVGLYAGSASPETIIDAMLKVATTSAAAETVKRAKSLAKGEALLALDGGSKVLAEAITASVLSGEGFSSPKDVAAKYDAVSDAQVKEALSTLLKSNPSLAAIGDISTVPYHATVKSSMS